MAISRLLSPSITTNNSTNNSNNINTNNNTNIKVPSSLPVKRGRGRPRKYANEEEQREARRAQILQSVRKYRQKQAETRASVSSGEARSEGSEGVGKSKSPSEHGGQGEERDGDMEGARQVQLQVVRGGDVRVRPRMLEAPAVEDAVLSMLDREIIEAREYDDYGVSEVHPPIEQTGGAELGVEHTEAQEDVEVSLAVVSRPQRLKQPERRILPRSASSPNATDVRMNNTALFLDGLLRDFMVSLRSIPTPYAHLPPSYTLLHSSAFFHPLSSILNVLSSSFNPPPPSSITTIIHH